VRSIYLHVFLHGVWLRVCSWSSRYQPLGCFVLVGQFYTEPGPAVKPWGRINDISSIKIRLTNVEKTNSALQQANLKLEAANLKLERAYKTLQQKTDVQECLLADLKTSSDGYKALRNRFLSVFKRRTMPEQLSNSDNDFISGGNAASHSGDCLYDAKLYFETRARRDYNVYAAIYGLAPGVVATAIGK
jgi:hypothetical protein